MAKKNIKVPESNEIQFVAQLKEIIRNARSKAYNSINFAQVEANGPNMARVLCNLPPGN
jgi:hypothetical protein